MGFWSSLMTKLGGGGSAGADFYDKLLGLAPGETIAFSAMGKYVHGWTREGTIGEQYILAITSADRLVIGDMQTMNPARARPYTRGSLRVRESGFFVEDGGIETGRKFYQQPGPTGALERVIVLAFAPATGEPFTLFAVESAVPQILAWCNG